MRLLGKFLVSSAISLLILILIFLLLTRMDQGGTIVIDLFYHPWQLILVLGLLFFLGILISHYPVYFEHALYDKDDLEWFLYKPFLGFGIVHYDVSNENFGKKDTLTFLRHSLGFIVFIVFHLILMDAYGSYFGSSSVLCIVFTLLIVSAIFLYYRCIKNERYWFPKIKENVKWIVLITLTGLMFTIVFAFYSNWHRVSIISLMGTNYLFLLCYMLFRFTRSKLLKEKRLREEQENKTKLVDNTIFLRRLRFIGVLILGFLLMINIFPEQSYYFNPVMVLLMYLSTYYSIVTIWLKHVLFYNFVHQNSEAFNKYKLYQYLLPSIPFLIFAWTFISPKLSSDLHELPRGKISETVTLGNYLKDLKHKVTSSGNPIKNHFFIGSYGGGLRANTWNMLLMNELQDSTKEENFFDHVAILSTVSGGSIGVGSYLTAWNSTKGGYKEKVTTMDSIINHIGSYNFLGIDLVSLFGRDLIREYFPFLSYKGHDRAYFSMKKYAELSSMDHEDFEGESYRSYWAKSYHKSKKSLPALVVNSTSITGRQSIAFSLEVDESKIDKVFPGTSNMLYKNEDQEDITFFSALSTSNRFPLFSPTAQINKKGHFLDGGYFDNSGLLSAYSFHEFLSCSDLSPNHLGEPVFINIINDKGMYIQHKIKEWEVEIAESTISKELSSILETLVSIDKIPNYISNKIEKEMGDRYIEVYMPFPFTKDELMSKLGGTPDDSVRIEEKIKTNNTNIEEALAFDKNLYDFKKWGVVVPPLARLLTEPAIQYQRAMIKHHPEVKSKIEKILGYVSE